MSHTLRIMWVLATTAVIGAVFGIGVHFASTPTFPVSSTGGIIVTGASSGIGLHAALELDTRGYKVFPMVRKEADADALRKERPSLNPIVADVTDDIGVAKALESVTAALALANLPLVGLVNNAGVSHRLPIELDTIERIRKLYEVNVFGVYRVTQTFLPHLRAGQGRIVNVGSVAALLPHPGSSAYSGTKAALEVMSDVMRMEFKPWNISVSLVEPAYVATKIASKQLGDNSPLKHVDQEKLKMYQKWADKASAKRAANEKLASPPDVTTNAIVDALTSAQPKTRYVVANVGGIPAWIVTWIAYLLPDNIQDILTLKV
eukprot:m.127214 g.127214  ORF g.127214 m.127214 type:complete len:319 (+) comp22215_c0_seq1:37-993(+)